MRVRTVGTVHVQAFEVFPNKEPNDTLAHGNQAVLAPDKESVEPNKEPNKEPNDTLAHGNETVLAPDNELAEPNDKSNNQPNGTLPHANLDSPCSLLAWLNGDLTAEQLPPEERESFRAREEERIANAPLPRTANDDSPDSLLVWYRHVNGLVPEVVPEIRVLEDPRAAEWEEDEGDEGDEVDQQGDDISDLGESQFSPN